MCNELRDCESIIETLFTLGKEGMTTTSKSMPTTPSSTRTAQSKQQQLQPQHPQQPRHPMRSTSTVLTNNSNLQWPCTKCTFLNHPALKFCEECEMPRFNLTETASTASAASNANHCQTENDLGWLWITKISIQFYLFWFRASVIRRAWCLIFCAIDTRSS